MKRQDIRQHRRQVRRFQRASGALLRGAIYRGATMAQCHVLLELERLGAASLLELTEALGLSKGTVSRTVDGLVGLGLVSRETDESDRRRVSLTLTKQGLVTLNQINKWSDRNVERIFARIPAENRDDVLHAFDILVKAVVETDEEDRRGKRAA